MNWIKIIHSSELKNSYKLFLCSFNRHYIIFWLKNILTDSTEILYLHSAKKTKELIFYFLIKWKILYSIKHIFILLQKWKQIPCKYFAKEREKNESFYNWQLEKWLSLAFGQNETLFCKTCISLKSIIELEKYYNPASTNGSTGLKWSALADHEKTACQIWAVT